MQPSCSVPGGSISVFQSSSSQKAGCNRHRRQSTRPILRFNPHPARRPDATGDNGRGFRLYNVSILIQPEGRMQPGWMVSLVSLVRWFQSSSSQKAGCNPDKPRIGVARDVSILIQPEGRMQPPVPARAFADPRFNPHPARRPDATTKHVQIRRQLIMFQSSSSQKAGCNNQPGYAGRMGYVSILIQPEGRMQRQAIRAQN